MKKIFDYDYFKEAFDYADEDIISDLSGITIAMCRDVHDESIELIVEVFGKEGMDGVAIISETICNPGDYLGNSFDPHAVYAEDILGLFDNELIKLLMDRALPAVFNPGWQTEVIVYPGNPDQKTRITIEEQ